MLSQHASPMKKQAEKVLSEHRHALILNVHDEQVASRPSGSGSLVSAGAGSSAGIGIGIYEDKMESWH